MAYNTNLAACKVEFWDPINEIERTEYCIVNGSTFTECVEDLQNFYGNELNTIQVTLLEDGPVIITEELAKHFMNDEVVKLNDEA